MDEHVLPVLQSSSHLIIFKADFPFGSVTETENKLSKKIQINTISMCLIRTLINLSLSSKMTNM